MTSYYLGKESRLDEFVEEVLHIPNIIFLRKKKTIKRWQRKTLKPGLTWFPALGESNLLNNNNLIILTIAKVWKFFHKSPQNKDKVITLSTGCPPNPMYKISINSSKMISNKK